MSVVAFAGACRSGDQVNYDFSQPDMAQPDMAHPDLSFADFSGDMAGGGDSGDAGPTGDMAVPIFAPATSYGAESGPIYLASGDVNGDGNRDLIVVNVNDPDGSQTGTATPATLNVLLGNGDGTFKPKVSYPISPLPFSITLATMKTGGHTDVLITNATGFDYLAGNGDGTFAAAVPTAVGTSGFDRGSAATDIDGDGKLDFVLADQGDLTANGVIDIVPGNGDGTFGTPVPFPVSTQVDPAASRLPNVLRVGFLDTGIKPDIVVGNSAADNTSSISILLNKSTPGVFLFGSPTEIISLKAPIDLVVQQLDAAHKTDIVSVNLGADSVSVYLSNSDDDTLSFATPVTYAAGTGPTAVATGDFDGDTKLDLIVANGTSNTVSLLYGGAAGTFSVATNNRPASEVAAVGMLPVSVVAATFNADAKIDAATANQLSSNVSVLINQR